MSVCRVCMAWLDCRATCDEEDQGKGLAEIQTPPQPRSSWTIDDTPSCSFKGFLSSTVCERCTEPQASVTLLGSSVGLGPGLKLPLSPWTRSRLTFCQPKQLCCWLWSLQKRVSDSSALTVAPSCVGIRRDGSSAILHPNPAFTP